MLTRFAIAAVVVALLAGCSADTVKRITGEASPAGAPTSAPATPDGTSPGDAPDSATQAPPDEGPDPREGRIRRESGGSMWALVLAITDKQVRDDYVPFEDPVLVEAAEKHDGYIVGVDCDEGSRAGLRLKPEKHYWYTALYFGNQTVAFEYKKRHVSGGVIGVVKVVPYNGQSAEDCVRRTPTTYE